MAEGSRASSSKEDVLHSDYLPKKAKLSKDVSRGLRKSPNIAIRLQNGQTHGSCLRRFSDLPMDFVQSYQERFVNVDKMPTDLLKICALMKKKDFSIKDKDFITLVEGICDLLLVDEKVHKASVEFFFSGGVDVLVEILVKNIYDDDVDITQHTSIKVVEKENIKITKKILQVVTMCTQMSPVGLEYLCTNRKFLHLLFSLLCEEKAKIYMDSTVLLEEILLAESKDVSFRLKEVACLGTILEKKLSPQLESHIYHALSATISMNDALLCVDASLQQYDSWLMSNSRAHINKENQEFLVSFPHFLKRLIRLSSAPMPEFRNASFQEFLNRFNPLHDIDDAVIEIFARIVAENSDDMLHQLSLFAEKTARSGAFVLLSILLTGQCRDKLQENVVTQNLVQGLEQIAEAAVWSELDPEVLPTNAPLDPVDGGPGVTVKVQYLRLIFAICDHHRHRYLLLNQQELKEIEDIAATCDVQTDMDFSSVDKSKCCRNSPGLLVQIVDKLKAEPTVSFVRYWMTRALESFLRGRRCVADQIFLLNKGLLEELFNVLLSDEQPISEVIQGHFDLLSCVMKKCETAFEKFSTVVNCSASFQKLCQTIDDNLVDSNMFVRCIILTLHHFDSDETKYKKYTNSCRILQHYSNLAKRVQSIVSLIGLLNVRKLTQENVSCLNTSIIILHIAKLNDQLPRYLSAILSHSPEGSHVGRQILENLRELLTFWLKHYSHAFKQNDIKSLEESTGFEFRDWKELVLELITKDATSSSSIQHYLTPTLNPVYALKASRVPSCSRTS